MKKVIETASAPKVVGPYSQAVEIGDWIFCSGQIGIDPKSNDLVSGDITAQTKQVFENLKAVLTSAGASLNTLLKTTVYLASMDDYVAMNTVYETYVGKPYPARATVAVAKLPKGALVEIECVAYKEKGGCEDGQCACCS